MKKTLITIVFAVLFCLAFSVAIQHVPQTTFTFAEEANLMLEIQQGLNDIAEIKVYYRTQGTETWYYETAKQENPGSIYYKVSIPAKALTTDPVEYYFAVQLKHGTTENFPAQDGLTPNYLMKPETMNGDASPGFVLLTDEPTISADDGYMLVVSFFALMGDVDPASIEVWVGGKNVTSQAQINAPTIIYKETRPQPGIKKAIVRGKIGSKQIHSSTWATEILPGTKLRIANPLNFRGNVNFASNLYDYSEANLTPGSGLNDAAAWTDLYASYGIMDMHTHLYVSSLEKTNLQPVNRYLFDLKIPHLDIAMGDYAPALSQYSLYGKNIRGLYGKLYSQHVALFVTHGQTVRRTTIEDDINPSEAGDQKTGTFKQEAFGTRLQFGAENDFMMGFNLTRHRDVISSLDSLYYQYTRGSGSELETIYTTPAKDNAVFAFDLRINLPEQKTVIGGEIATSMLNTNTIPGPITQEELETYTGQEIVVDPSEYSNLFVINKNMEPFIPTRANMAWQMYFRSYFWNNLISAQYAETGSAFNALGASYLMNDSKAITVSDQLNISRYFLLNGGFTLSEDNLMGHKAETNRTTSWFAQSILRLPKAPYLKAAFYSNESKNKDNLDVALVEADKYVRKSNSLSFGIGYNISQIPVVPTQLDISYRMGGDNSDKTTKVDTLYVLSRITENENNGLSITMFNKFTVIPLTTQFAMSLNNQKDLLLITDGKNQSLFFGAGYGFWENRIKPYVNYRMVSYNSTNSEVNYGYATLGVEAYPLTDLTVNTSLGLQNHSNKLDNSKDYNNLTWRVLLTQRF